MDFEQVLELSPGCTVEVGTLPTCATPMSSCSCRRHRSRSGRRGSSTSAKNAVIADELADELTAGWDGVIVVVTNPVDPLVTRLQRRTGLDRRRILGYTLNDSLRLRTGLAKALGVPPGSVDAWVLGEHGDKSVPLLDRVSVNGVHVAPHRRSDDAALEYSRTWYVRHVALDSGRSSTWTSGLGVARMVAALDGDGELWPASVVLDGEYGIEGVAVTVPVTIGRGGAEQIHEWELAARRCSMPCTPRQLRPRRGAESIERRSGERRRDRPERPSAVERLSVQPGAPRSIERLDLRALQSGHVALDGIPDPGLEIGEMPVAPPGTSPAGHGRARVGPRNDLRPSGRSRRSAGGARAPSGRPASRGSRRSGPCRRRRPRRRRRSLAARSSSSSGRPHALPATSIDCPPRKWRILTPFAQPGLAHRDELVRRSLRPGRHHAAVVEPDGAEPLPVTGVAPDDPVLDELPDR